MTQTPKALNPHDANAICQMLLARYPTIAAAHAKQMCRSAIGLPHGVPGRDQLIRTWFDVATLLRLETVSDETEVEQARRTLDLAERVDYE